jgi:hypothetical protein
MKDILKRNKRLLILMLLILSGVQFIFWFNTKEIYPDMTIIDNPPGPKAVKALSFGDEQFYYRYMALDLQNAGDGYGRFTPLKDYNYEILYRWLFLLDELDYQNNFTPAIASYYFAATQYKPDVIYIVNYLEQHYDRLPDQKWWWLGQAVYLANHKLDNNELALRLAYKLANSPSANMPMWAKQMPAFIHEQMGEDEEAFAIMIDIMKNQKSYSQYELNFMAYFLNDRLKKFVEKYHLQVDKKDYQKQVDEYNNENPEEQKVKIPTN